ncbi:MAG: dihydropteroate synthase [Armatimonadota bacterium]
MFTIVAERINCTRKTIREATENRDAEFIQGEAKRQAEAGATYIDVNAGMHPDTEKENMQWLVGQVQAVTDLPICIDSPNAAVVAVGLEALDGRPSMINSISVEEGRTETLLPLVQKFNSHVVGLCLGPEGLPNSAEERLDLASRLLEKTRAAGVADARVHIDPLVRCVSTEGEQGAEFLKAIRLIHAAHPEVNFCAGMSNVSFGLPQRTLLNRAFLSIAIWEGLNGAIIDPLDKGVMAQLFATNAVIGLDEYCMEYMTAVREGLLV